MYIYIFKNHIYNYIYSYIDSMLQRIYFKKVIVAKKRN